MALVPATAAEARCPTGGRTYTATENARVYQVKGGVFYACHRAAGRPIKLDAPNALEPTFVVTQPPKIGPRLAGRWVAWVESFQAPASGGEDVLFRADLRRRREFRPGYDTGESGGGSFEGIALTTRGGLAWSLAGYEPADGSPGTNAIFRLESGSPLLLDSGDAIEPASLALSANQRRLYWLNGGEARSAALP